MTTTMPRLELGAEAPAGIGWMANARRLLIAGMTGSHLVAAGCVVAFTLTDGSRGAASALLAALVTIAFHFVGHWVVYRNSTGDPRRLLAIALISHGVRGGLLLVLLGLYQTFGGGLQQLSATALAITVAATMVGWLAAEIWTFSRLRFPVYDEPSDSGFGRGSRK
ncbi:hypothetical protein ACQBAR_07595 [Propionibacteriaceae bacterium Y1685]